MGCVALSPSAPLACTRKRCIAVRAGTPRPTICLRSIDAEDIDALSASMREPYELRYDLNRDQRVDADDHRLWVHKISGTYFGDANLDGEFNSSDLVQVFVAGKYEAVETAGWSEGDWDGDFQFESGDLVFAFADGGYEFGPRVGPMAVPEPSSYRLVLLGALAVMGMRRRRIGSPRWRFGAL